MPDITYNPAEKAGYQERFDYIKTHQGSRIQLIPAFKRDGDTQ